MEYDRRAFLQLGAATAIGVAGALAVPEVVGALGSGPIGRFGDGPYGPLGAADEHGLRLPAGFSGRIVAQGDRLVAGTDYVWHVFPDGGATFPARNGWIYVSNSEHPGAGAGGASALRFDADGEVVDAYRVLAGTQLNCAGGATPWGTWVSGEEHDRGLLWECDPTGQKRARSLEALGTFSHEAAAFDPARKQAYLTEDEPDGRFYRFTAAKWPELTAGKLEVASVDQAGKVRWRRVPDPAGSTTPTRAQVPESTAFKGGEGIVFDRGVVYFTTKGDDRVWAYDTKRARIRVHYDGTVRTDLPLHGVDNINVTPRGDLVVAEDGGDMQLVLLTTGGVAAPLLQLTGQNGSELTGPAFSPDGKRLYFSSQRGAGGPGITYEVTGPFAAAKLIGRRFLPAATSGPPGPAATVTAMVNRRMGRRAFLLSGAAAAGVVGAACASPPPPITKGGNGPYGPLGAADTNGIQLPSGFTSRVVARGKQTVPGTNYIWHTAADGGACFPTGDDGWIYVSNSEAFPGGVSALRFSSDANVTAAYSILSGTVGNCAGGATPWGTWLSGEEYFGGRIWECDPTGTNAAQARTAMGVFTHEAAAVDPDARHVYMTEDVTDGRFYRYIPFSWPDLSNGFLQVATVAGDNSVTWTGISDPGAVSSPTRTQVPGSTPFNGGEGIVYRGGVVYFSTKGDDRVWAYNTGSSRISVHYDGMAQPSLALHGVDNIGVSPFGELLVCEDHGNMELVILGTDGSSAPFLRVTGQDSSELAGVAFNPSGTRLYVSSQRGGGNGITYEVTGPFGQRMASAGGAAGASVLPPVAVAPGAALALAAAGGVWQLRNRLVRSTTTD